MCFKKKPVEKPSKIKIDMAFDKCKEAIQELLNDYGTRIEGYLAKITNLKKEKRFSEADRYKEKLKLVIARQTKMMDLMDQVEQFGFMIDEAFAKNTVYGTLGSILNETNKMNMAPEIKSIVKNMNTFERQFKKDCVTFNSIFSKISKSVVNIDNSTYDHDSEIDSIVNSRMQDYDQETTRRAEEVEDLFNLN